MNKHFSTEDEGQPEYHIWQHCPRCGSQLTLHIENAEEDGAFFALQDLQADAQYVVSLFCNCSAFEFVAPVRMIENDSPFGTETTENPMTRSASDDHS